jgi:hypothetical protein
MSEIQRQRLFHVLDLLAELGRVRLEIEQATKNVNEADDDCGPSECDPCEQGEEK